MLQVLGSQTAKANNEPCNSYLTAFYSINIMEKKNSTQVLQNFALQGDSFRIRKVCGRKVLQVFHRHYVL